MHGAFFMQQKGCEIMAHAHSVYDNDRHFSIDPVTREIKNESGKFKLIRHDHNSERFTFEIPKVVDGHDMSLCNVVQVHYLNIEAGKDGLTYEGLYECDDLQVSPDSADVVIFSWLLSRNATQYAGSLNFVIYFACVAEDGTVEYAWSTDIHTGIIVGDTIHNSEVIVAEYADILEKWRQELILANVVETYTPEEFTEMFGVVTKDYVDNTLNAMVQDSAVTLLAASWADNAQEVNVAAVTSESTVIVSPAPASHSVYAENGIYCSAQAAGTLTFTCESAPSVDVMVNVTVINKQGESA